MPGVETLRDFVNQRLTAAAEEIFGVFERTIAEYEEQLCRCKEENERKQKLLDDVQLHFHRADNQQLQVPQEEVSSEPQSSSLEQEDTEPPHIKEEEEELWSSQEGIKEAYPFRFSFAPVSVKTEDDEEKPQSSQLHEIQSEGMKTGADGEDCGGPEQARNSEPERHLHPESQGKTGDGTETETDDSDDWRVTMEHDYGLNRVENFDDDRSVNDEKSHSCPICGRAFRWKFHLGKHMQSHKDNQQLQVAQEETPSDQQKWSSSLEHKDAQPPHIKDEEEELWGGQVGLDEAYTIKFPVAPASVKTEDDEKKPQSSQLHEKQSEGMKTEADGEDYGGPEQARNSETERLLHPETQGKTGDGSEAEIDVNVKKSHSCSQCIKTFRRKYDLAKHMRTHQEDKPFSCSDCGKRFRNKETQIKHMVIHTGKKPFSCSECDKRFFHKSHLSRHVFVHTGEKRFSCSGCDKTFYHASHLNRHMFVHTGEKPLSCSECGKKFSHKSHLNRHMFVHTGEKPFSCPQCDKTFSLKSNLTTHMVIHTREKPFSCELCDQKFLRFTQVKKHKCTGGQTS